MIPPKITILLPRLATEHVGELVATRNAISRLLQSAGLDWHDLAGACARTPPVAGKGIDRSAASFGDMARAARDLDRGRLTPRERAFVADMCAKGFSFQPSPRQAAWLADILDRLNGRAAA